MSFKAEDLRVGDVIRCPGYPSIKFPARMSIVADDDPMRSLEGSDRHIQLGISNARSMFPKYGKFNDSFNGCFWAIERDGKQIYPAHTDDSREKANK